MTADHPDIGPPGHEPWDALARYLAGESTPGEAERVRRWLATDPRLAEWLAALERGTARLAATPPTAAQVEAALARVRARFGVAAAPARRWPTIALRAAAAVALVAGATLVWRLAISGPGTTPATARSYVTAVGQLDSIRLPDGSLAVLGPASRLEVPAGFGEAGREVALQGQGLFDVAPGRVRPFRVRADGAVIEDLGTTFAVRAGDGEVRVVVTAGSVALGTDGTVLAAGDRAVLAAGGGTTVERGVVTDDDVAWTRRHLVFTNAPLTHVAAELSRWYGVGLRADSVLASRHLTATFNGEPVDDVLRAIALALGASVDRQGDTVRLRAR
jgi:transmembrane sensor